MLFCVKVDMMRDASYSKEGHRCSVHALGQQRLDLVLYLKLTHSVRISNKEAFQICMYTTMFSFDWQHQEDKILSLTIVLILLLNADNSKHFQYLHLSQSHRSHDVTCRCHFSGISSSLGLSHTGLH
jgi:hypothetical protein